HSCPLAELLPASPASGSKLLRCARRERRQWAKPIGNGDFGMRPGLSRADHHVTQIEQAPARPVTASTSVENTSHDWPCCQTCKRPWRSPAGIADEPGCTTPGDTQPAIPMGIADAAWGTACRPGVVMQPATSKATKRKARISTNTVPDKPSADNVRIGP